MKTFAIAGHLGTDPKLETKGETTWTRVRVAANGRETDWFTITAFGKLAEAIAKNLQKGDGIAVRGELRTKTYEGKERIELHAREADFFAKAR